MYEKSNVGLLAYFAIFKYEYVLEFCSMTMALHWSAINKSYILHAPTDIYHHNGNDWPAAKPVSFYVIDGFILSQQLRFMYEKSIGELVDLNSNS